MRRASKSLAPSLDCIRLTCELFVTITFVDSGPAPLKFKVQYENSMILFWRQLGASCLFYSYELG